jgi:tRNA nucleotidyltransferase (CCA-adding enzyme)
VGELALDGGDLIRMGMKPGPQFRRVLEELLEQVLEDPALNAPERLEEIVQRMGVGGVRTPGRTGSA